MRETVKITFANNSCGGLNRSYHGFELDLKGHSERTLDVPVQYVDNLRGYLKQHHPAVTVTMGNPEVSAAPVVSEAKSSPATSEAAITADTSVLDINLDDQEEGGISVEQHLRNLGLLSAPPKETTEASTAAEPATTPAAAPQEAPAEKATGKRKGAANLKPAKPKAGK